MGPGDLSQDFDFFWNLSAAPGKLQTPCQLSPRHCSWLLLWLLGAWRVSPQEGSDLDQSFQVWLERFSEFFSYETTWSGMNLRSCDMSTWARRSWRRSWWPGVATMRPSATITTSTRPWSWRWSESLRQLVWRRGQWSAANTTMRLSGSLSYSSSLIEIKLNLC